MFVINSLYNPVTQDLKIGVSFGVIYPYESQKEAKKKQIHFSLKKKMESYESYFGALETILYQTGKLYKELAKADRKDNVALKTYKFSNFRRVKEIYIPSDDIKKSMESDNITVAIKYNHTKPDLYIDLIHSKFTDESPIKNKDEFISEIDIFKTSCRRFARHFGLIDEDDEWFGPNNERFIFRYRNYNTVHTNFHYFGHNLNHLSDIHELYLTRFGGGVFDRKDHSDLGSHSLSAVREALLKMMYYESYCDNRQDNPCLVNFKKRVSGDLGNAGGKIRDMLNDFKYNTINITIEEADRRVNKLIDDICSIERYLTKSFDNLKESIEDWNGIKERRRWKQLELDFKSMFSEES